MPPARTGVAVYSAELVAELRREHDIDVFEDQPGTRSAHEFVWRHRTRPYDLAVYQVGNSSFHDFLWPYLFRFPGLAVLHDARLYHARAAALLRQQRPDDYRAEFAANHPETSPDLAELAVAQFDSHLYYRWPMTRLITRASRVTATHATLASRSLQDDSPGAKVESIRLGHGVRLSAERIASASAAVRARHAIPSEAVLFGVFGGLTPEKRLPQVLDAFAALLPYQPSARLLLAGSPAGHYDVTADVSRHGLATSVVLTGYVDHDAAFTEYIAACDVSINLRWPTAREMSGPWLRALAAGRATVISDLAHTADVAVVDPRTWLPVHASSSVSEAPEPVAVSIDVRDEAHSLRLALRRLASDPELRARLGRAALAFWEREHSLPRMLEDYRRVIARAIAAPVPNVTLPRHLRASGTERLSELLRPFGLAEDLWSRI